MRAVPLMLAASIAASADGPGKEATLKLYEAKCLSCHLADGNSPLPETNFADGVWKHGNRPADLGKVIREGVAGTAMLPFKEQLTPKEIQALAEYVRAFDKKAKDSGKKAK